MIALVHFLLLFLGLLFIYAELRRFKSEIREDLDTQTQRINQHYQMFFYLFKGIKDE